MDRRMWSAPYDARVVVGCLQLRRGEVLTVRPAQGALVFVESGGAWITQENDTRDVVLAPGEWLRLDLPGTAVVQATGRATLTVTAPLGRPAPEVALSKPPAHGDGMRGSLARRLWAGWMRLYRRSLRPRPWEIRMAPSWTSVPGRPRLRTADPLAPMPEPGSTVAALRTGVALDSARCV